MDHTKLRSNDSTYRVTFSLLFCFDFRFGELFKKKIFKIYDHSLDASSSISSFFFSFGLVMSVHRLERTMKWLLMVAAVRIERRWRRT